MRLGNYLLLLVALFLASCAAPDTQHHIVISTRDQKLAVLDRGTLLTMYPVSTSKFGLGDYLRSSRTPLGELEVAKKIGDNAPLGCVFKDRIGRNCCVKFSRSRSDCHAHSLAART